MSDIPVRWVGTWINVFIGVVAAAIWASNALRAVFGDDDLSTRALFASLALVLTGLALGTVMSVLGAPARARRLARGVPPEDVKTTNLLSALMLIGLGTAPILDPSVGAWDWALTVAASLVGGLLLGVAFAVETPDWPRGSRQHGNDKHQVIWSIPIWRCRC